MVIIDSRKKVGQCDGANIGIAIESDHKTGKNTYPQAFTSLYENAPGIIHRLENAAYTSPPPYQLAESHAENQSMFSFFSSTAKSQSPQNVSSPLPRCPCCRENTSQMFCVVCSLQQLRINRIRESYRIILRRKAETCQKIAQKLRDQKNIQHDNHIKERSVKSLKAAISSKRTSIERIRLRLRNVIINTESMRKNNISLEKKIAGHNKRDFTVHESILHQRESLRQRQITHLEVITNIFKELSVIFPICPQKQPVSRRSAPPKSALQQKLLPDAWRNALQNTRVRRPPYFSIRGLNINDEYALETLLTEEHCRLLDNTQTHSKSIFNTLANNMIYPLKIRGCKTKPCRQTLGAMLYITRYVEMMAAILDKHLPYDNLYQKCEELCDTYRKRVQTQSQAAKQSILRAYLFELSFDIISLGSMCGVLNAQTADLKCPIYNLLDILQNITNRTVPQSQSPFQTKRSEQQTNVEVIFSLSPTLDSYSEKLYDKIMKEYEETHHDQLDQEFNLVNVEEDWVNVS